MLSKVECVCGENARDDCTGYITKTELKMNLMDPRHSAQEYHEIMNLFVDAFYVTEEIYGSTD